MNGSDFKMKYSLATNFETDLIEGIKDIDKGHAIKSVFGKLRGDMVGGGRPEILLPDPTIEELENYIELCHQSNLEFNYLLNPLCLGNKEFIKESHNQIIKHIETLINKGIDAVTINSPYLCEVFKRRFPNLKITIGVASSICELQQIKFWEDLGADEITILQGVNRNFDLLKNMLNYTKKTGTTIRLIANNACLHACPYRIAHGSGQAHTSRQGEFSEKFNADYNFLRCTLEKIRNPAAILAAEWIRPEDVKYYRALCEETGNTNFSIKLVDRTKTTNFLLRVVKAYLFESYNGNLLDLLFWPSFKEFIQMDSAWAETAATLNARTANTLSLEKISRYLDFWKYIPNFYVDNQKLDGFLDKFVTKFDCCNKVCNQAVSSNQDKMDHDDSSGCSYCKSWAGKVISFNTEQVDQWLDKSDRFLNDLCTSKFFQ